MFHRVFANPPPGRLDLVRLHLKGGHMREEPLLSMYFLLLKGIFTGYIVLFSLHITQSTEYTSYYCYCYCFPCILFYTMSTVYTICAQCTQCVRCTLYMCTLAELCTHCGEKWRSRVCGMCQGFRQSQPGFSLRKQRKSLLFLQMFCLISFVIFKYHFHKRSQPPLPKKRKKKKKIR